MRVEWPFCFLKIVPTLWWECLNGRSAFSFEWDAERPGLHSHAERGNDQYTTDSP
jgi:hypothetical protein